MHETAQKILQQKRNQLEKEQMTAEPACLGKDLISVLRTWTSLIHFFASFTLHTVRANAKLPDDEKMSDLELTGQMTSASSYPLIFLTKLIL